MKKVLAVILMMMATSAIVSAQDKTPQERREAFKERSQVVADSIRSKGTRFGKRVAEGTAVAVDSVGSKGQRVGRKARVVGDTVAVRSKKAWKALKGE